MPSLQEAIRRSADLEIIVVLLLGAAVFARLIRPAWMVKRLSGVRAQYRALAAIAWWLGVAAFMLFLRVVSEYVRAAQS